MPESLLSNSYQNISLKSEESPKRVAEKIRSMAASKLKEVTTAIFNDS